MRRFRLVICVIVAGCSSVQVDRAVTTAQYMTPLAVGVIALQSFGSDE